MKHTFFDWAVVGAGPAGIACVGRLLDSGVARHRILWVDPYFTVGDFGRLWSNVSSNTKAKLFQQFLLASPAFRYADVMQDFPLHLVPRDNTCQLALMAAPLQWVSDKLCQQVVARKGLVHDVTRREGYWHLTVEHDVLAAHKVVFATGAEPSSLSYPGIEAIPFEVAIDKERLRTAMALSDTIGVFGASHSAIIMLRHLVELGVKRIVNFYTSPCRYAMDMGDWILFDNTGLKGEAALWAREYIDGTLPDNLERVNVREGHVSTALCECDRVVYAVGFTRRKSLFINGYGDDVPHHPTTGILAPGLFGLGIAYPEEKRDPMGNLETQVGLWKFMTYLDRIMPIWHGY